MCRWMAYSGDPILAYELLFRPQHSIIDQSLHSKLGAETTNGDGFGIGWYGEGLEPALFKSIDQRGTTGIFGSWRPRYAHR